MWDDFNRMLNSTMQNWKLCNLVCYTNWWPLIVDHVIHFLSVLISTDLAGQMANSVDYMSVTTYFNYLFLLLLFFFSFPAVFFGEKLVFQRVYIYHAGLQEYIWLINFLLTVVFNIYREHFALRGHLNIFEGLLDCLLTYFIAAVPLVLFDVLSLNSKYNAKLLN